MNVALDLLTLSVSSLEGEKGELWNAVKLILHTEGPFMPSHSLHNEISGGI